MERGSIWKKKSFLYKMVFLSLIKIQSQGMRENVGIRICGWFGVQNSP